MFGNSFMEMLINSSTGDYTLVIDSVTLEDDAIFQCQVGPGPPESGIRELRSADAKLTVDVPTGPPVIIQGETLATSEDREISLECVSRAGKPAAEVGGVLDSFFVWKFLVEMK